MGERTSYENGTFNWVELGTDDPAAARAFYSSLLGWEAVAVPGGHGDYSQMKLDGKTVAAILKRGAKQPVNAWLSYVAVDDVDATAARAEELGGTVGAGPFDLGAAGRAAFISDPTDAWLGLWQAGEFIGAEWVNDPGTLTMNQLNTSDPDRAASFYNDLFGWEIEAVDSPGDPYWSIRRGDGPESLNGGMMRLPEGAASSHWFVYFTTADLDASAAKARELGGQVLVPPMEVPAGRFAVLSDPTGAAFALFEGEVDP